MFIDIDLDKRSKEYKIELAKPNKQIITNLYEKTGSKLNLKLGGLNELNFSIPYYVENEEKDGMIENKNIKRIKELMYLRLTWGEYQEWFVIDNISDESDETEIMNIQAFSIGYELKRKNVEGGYQKTAINAREFFGDILQGTSWKIGVIDNSFEELYRSFDEGETDRFSLIQTAGETFGGIIEWDNENKKINLKELGNIGEYKGFSINYDRLMSGLSKKRTTDDIVTRLYVYGNEGLTIENVNPTNNRYIEDYSYFLYPFKRDSQKNVLDHSDYMSDALCHAILDNQELKARYEPQIKTLQTTIDTKNKQLSTEMIKLDDLNFSLASAKGLLDIAKAVDDKDLITQRNQEVAVMSGKVTQQKIVVDNLKSEIQTLQNQIVNLQEAISIRNFSQELLDELDPYIIERKIEDARYIDERELYQFGVDKFAELRAPKVVIETSINGFLNAVEEQYYWDKLVIGDKMRVRQERMGIDYLATMIEMEVDLDSSDVDVKVANHTEELNDMDKFISILYSSQSSSTIVNNNKYKWDSILDVRDEVTQLRDSEIDATQKRITAGVNESVEIGERGIIITTPSFPDEMIIMQAGVIALSEDGGQNWKTSIRPQGVVAETIIGKLIAGNNLIITNSSGSFVMDNNGLEIDADSIKIMSGGENPKNIIDEWNNMIIDMGNFADDGTLTPYEKSQISHQWNMIQDSHSRMIISYMDNMGAETEENPYPQEYDDYIRTYESLKAYLFQTVQQDGYAILHPNRMSQTSPVDIVQYRNIVQQYMTAKDNFTLVVPMDYANAYMEVLRESISLNYVKNDEIMARLNLSEEGVRIDGKLLSINSRTEFNDDLVMNAGNIRSKDGGIRIDLNAGTIDLARTLTINAVPVATKEDIDNIQFTYSATLSNDIASIPTDEDGKNGDYFTAVTTMTIYQGAVDDTPNWTFSIEKSNGIYGTLVGSTYTVTRLDDSVDSGYVDIIGRKGEEKIKKRFSISKNKQGYAGYQGKDAKILRLNANGYVLTYNNDNTPNPATQSITLDAVLENMTGTVNWTATPYVGATAQAPIILSGSGNSRVINQGIFTGNVDSIKIKAELDGRSDTITITKLKHGQKGDTGDSAKLLYLSATAETMTFNADNTPNPTNQLITFTANLQNTTGIATFTATPYSGTTALANITLGGSGNIRTLGHAQFPQNADRVEVKAILNNLTDTITIVKLKNGATGSDGKDAIVGYLTNESVTIPSNSEGVVTSADLTKANGTFRVFEGLVERTTETAVVFSRISQTGATATINANGTYSISALSTDSATVVFRASYKGLNIDKTLTIAKSRAGEKGETGESGRTYWLTLSDSVIAKNPQGGYTPSKVKFSSFSKIGDGLPEAYSGRFIVQTSSDGEAFVDAYKSTINESSYEFTLPNDIKSIRVKLYQAGGTVSLLDEQSIPVLVDIDSGVLEGATLADKTTLLSGTEIFTDKADDDGVVHVEVDGKSVQNAKSDSKNLAPNPEHWEYSSGASYDSKTEEVTLPVNGRIVFWVRWDGSTATATLSFNTILGSGFLWNTEYYGEDKVTRVYENSNTWTGNGMVCRWDANTIRSVVGTPSLNSNTKWIKMFFTGAPSYTPSTVKIKDIALRSNGSVYEPPAPTPDYPIAIHSLNDFDVVSSVGKENLLTGTTSEWRSNRVGNGGYASFHHGLTRFSDVGLKEGDTVTFSLVLKTNSSYGVRARFEQFLDNDRRITEVSDTVYSEASLASVTATIKNPYNQFRVGVQAGQTPAPEQIDYEYRLEKLEINGVNTLYSPSPEDIQSDKTSPTIYKTNILLSEPLRSVGDVKDRLFRDSDGLWKVERNVGQEVLNGNTNLQTTGAESYEAPLSTNRWVIPSRLMSGSADASFELCSHLPHVNYVWSLAHSPEGTSVNASNQFHLRFLNSTVGIASSDNQTTRSQKIKSYFAEQLTKGTPVTIQYQLKTPYNETLPQADQDKLNNIASYKDSNYVYTIVDKTNILPSYVRDNLKPNLRATFKSSGWYYRFRTTTELNKSIKETKNQYYLSTSSTSLVGGTWLDIAPVWENEKYMWQRSLVTRVDGTTYYTPSANGTNISGAKGDSSVVGYLTNESITFATDNVGNILPTDMSKATGTFKVFEGLVEKTTDASCQFFKVSESGATANIASNGVYTISSMTQDNATITFRAVYRGVTIDKVLNLSKAKRGDNGTSPITGFLTNEAITLPASNLGTVTSYVGATGLFEVYDGITKVNASQVTFSVIHQPNLIVNINTSGQYTVTTMSSGANIPNSTATLRAVYKGVTIDRVITVSKSFAGSDGSSATSYWINSSVNAIKRNIKGLPTPDRVTFSGYSKTGTSDPSLYSGRFIISTSSNGTTYTTKYTSSGNQSSYTYIIPSDAKFVKASLYQAGGTSVLLDEQTIPILIDADGIEIGGRNLIVRRFIEKGKYLDPATGTVLEALHHSMSGYIPITGNTDYILSAPRLIYQLRVVFYGSERNYISGNLYSLEQGKEKLVTTPSNASFMRISQDHNAGDKMEDMMLEKGNKASAYRGAPEDEAQNDNLLKKSNVPVENGNYNINNYSITNTIPDGTRVTATIWGFLATTRTDFVLYNSGGSVQLAKLKYMGNGIYQSSFVWKGQETANNQLYVYQFVSTQTGTSRIDKIKLEYGDVGTEYSLSMIEVKEDLDNKADQGNLDAVIGDVDAIKEGLDGKVDNVTYAEQNNMYEEWLTTVETNANNALSTSAQIEETQLLIHNNLLDQAQRWTTLEGFVQIDSPTNSFSIKSNNSGTQMILTDDALNFISGGEVVASITNQYLKIERGIFTSSAQIGRHKFEPLATNPDHFILSYVQEGS